MRKMSPCSTFCSSNTLPDASTTRTAPLPAISNVLSCEPYSSAFCAIRPTLGTLPIVTPHLAAIADHWWHGGVDDHVAGHVQVGDALVGIDHRQLWLFFVASLDVGFDLGALGFRQRGDFCEQVAEAVVDVDTQLLDGRGVLLENILEIDRNSMAEHDRVGNLHHRGLEVQ